MPHLDPYGYGANTPRPSAPPDDQPIPVAERQQEVELARDIPASEQQSTSDDLTSSGLDPALRLQDAVGSWPDDGDTTPEEVGEPDSSTPGAPEAEPFVPLTDSGDQGI
jgi:hypothetical protein